MTGPVPRDVEFRRTQSQRADERIFLADQKSDTASIYCLLLVRQRLVLRATVILYSGRL